MATLTLKKAKLIGETPLENLSGKYVVMRQSKSTRGFRFTCFHETKELAEREAARLGKETPDRRYLVLQIL